ncbi:MAG: hypothetical protein J6P87_09390 [Lachnospiraceae bacterium]|nr:hypothetical protein [Lachnospiraceae bacterium]
MSISAGTMGAMALAVFFILILFYAGSLMERIPAPLLQFISCTLLALAAVLYVMKTWQDPVMYLIKLILLIGAHLCTCMIADVMFRHRRTTGNYAVIVSLAFAVLMLPVFLGEKGETGKLLPIRLFILIPTVMVMAGFLFTVRQLHRKKTFDWIMAAVLMAPSCILCRELLPALITAAVIYLFELLRRRERSMAAAFGGTAAVLAAVAASDALGLSARIRDAFAADAAGLPPLTASVISRGYLMVMIVFLLAGTVLCPFLRYFVMNRRISVAELYPLVFTILVMAFYMPDADLAGGSPVDARAALCLWSFIPLTAAAVSALYERCAGEFDLAQIFGGAGSPDTPDDEDAGQTGSAANVIPVSFMISPSGRKAAEEEGTGGIPEDVNLGDRGDDGRDITKKDEELIDSLFMGHQAFTFTDDEEKESGSGAGTDQV